MEQDKEKIRRKNLMLGCTMAILVVALYVSAFYFGAGG